MLFNANAISITVEMQEREHLDVIKSVFGLVKVYWNRFVDVVFDTTSMFSAAFSQCAAGLANVLTRKGGVLFNAIFAVD